MAINDKTQSPADLLAADMQSGIQDLQATQDKDLIQVASGRKDVIKSVLDVVQEGSDSATKKRNFPNEQGQATQIEANTSAEAASKYNIDDPYLFNFSNDEDVLINLRATSPDLKSPINKVSQDETAAKATDELANILQMGKDYNKKNVIFTPEQVVAAKSALLRSSDNVTKLAKAIQDGDNSSATGFLFREAVARHAQLIKVYKYGRANVARALNAFKIPGDFVGSKAEFQKLVFEEIGGSRAAETMAKHILDVGDDPIALNKYLEDSFGKRTVKGIMEIYMNGLLSSPRTQFRNLFGNALFQLYKIPELTFSAGYGAVEHLALRGLNKINLINNKHIIENEADRIYFTEVYARLVGTLRAIRPAFKFAAQAVRDKRVVGDTKMDMPRNQMPAIYSDQQNAFGSAVNIFGKFIRMPGEALVFGDELFKYTAKAAEESQIAMHHAINLQRQGMNADQIAEEVAELLYVNPTVIKQVDEAKLESVFQNKLPAFMEDFQRIVAKVKIPYLDFPILRVHIPFIKTPFNIYKVVYNRSLGPALKATALPTIEALWGFYRIGSRLAGNPDPGLALDYSKKFMNDAAFRQKEMGLFASAASVFAISDALFQSGRITGPAPSDFAQREYYTKTLGVQPYSFVFYGPNSDRSKPLFDDKGMPNGDLRYVSYAGIEPFGSFLGITAATRNIMRNSSDPMLNESLTMAYVLSTAQYFKQMPFLTGLSDLLDIFETDDEEDAIKLSNFAKQYSRVGLPWSSFANDITNVFNQDAVYTGAKYEHDYEMFLKDKDGKVMIDDFGTPIANPQFLNPTGGIANGLEQYTNEVSKLYGGKNLLPKKYDYFGQEITGDHGFGLVTNMYNAFFPFRYAAGGDAKDYEKDIYRLGTPGYKRTRQIKGIRLNDSQWSLFNKTLGELRLDIRGDINDGLTFKEAVELLYSGTTRDSNKFLYDPQGKGSIDDNRIGTLRNLRNQYANEAFSLLVETNPEFAKMSVYKDSFDELLQDQMIGEFYK